MKRRSGGGSLFSPRFQRFQHVVHAVRKAWVERLPAQGQKAGAGDSLAGKAAARFRLERFGLWRGHAQQSGEVRVDFSQLHGGAVRQVVDAGGRFPERAEQVQGGHGVIPVDVVDPPVHVSGEGRALLAVLGDEHAAVRPVESSQPDDGASRGQNRLFRLNEEAAFSGGGVDVMFLRDPASVRDAIDGGAGAEDDRRSGEGFQRVLRSADVEAAVGFL